MSLAVINILPERGQRYVKKKSPTESERALDRLAIPAIVEPQRREGGGFFGFDPTPYLFYQPSTKTDSPSRVAIVRQEQE